ncbi:hypothetical protein BDW72DRAFT_199035 [Aspergillus terricola var. indicus]
MDAIADLKQSAAGTSKLTDEALIHTHQKLVDLNKNQLVFPALQQIPQERARRSRRIKMPLRNTGHIFTAMTFKRFRGAQHLRMWSPNWLPAKNAQQKGTRKQGKSQQHLDKLLERIHHYSSVIDSAAQGSPSLSMWFGPLSSFSSSKGYYVKLFREATTFGALWPLFLDIVKALRDVWIVLDSIHGCRTKIKLVIGSRHTSDLSPATNTVFEYSASDLRQVSVDYIAHEAAEMGEQGSLLREVTTDFVDTVDRLGGQMAWRGTLIHLVKAASSVFETQAFSREYRIRTR